MPSPDIDLMDSLWFLGRFRMIPDRLWEILAPFVDAVPEIVIAFLLISIGLRMIQGKKEELDGDNN